MVIKRRVLMLHGFSRNARAFSQSLDALKKEAKDVELVFLDAPFVLKPVDLAAGPPADDPTLNPEVQSNNEQERDVTFEPRGWWTWSPEQWPPATGLAESIALVRDILKERKFDGIFGFSQGAAFAAVISALLEKPHLYPPFLVDGKPPHPPLKFCIVVSGFKLPDPICNPLFASPYSTPTLHIFGKQDAVVTARSSRRLAQISSNKRIVEHEGGHFVPLSKDWLKLLVEFLRNPSGDPVLVTKL